MPRPRVALVSGHWGQNIGNAFFNVGGRWILKSLFGEVEFIADQPGYRTFHDQAQGNPANAYDILADLDIDRIVLQGPVLTQTTTALWAPTLDKLRGRGTRYSMIGAAFFKFRESELSSARQFLQKYPPELISTRDPETYRILKSWGLNLPIYSGIDSAFFTPREVSPFAISEGQYYTFNFDRYIEPTVTVHPSGTHPRLSQSEFDWDGDRWSLNTPQRLSRLAHSSKVKAYLGHAMDRRRLPAELNGLPIVRPEHRVNPFIGRKVYQHPNSIASDEPWTYLTLYANTALTLADRVHACVATLAYGRPAMLFTPSPRAALFEAVGATEIRSRPVVVPEVRLLELQESQMEWLRSHYS